MNENIKILIVEDDEGLSRLMKSRLLEIGENIEYTKIGKESIKWANENQPCLLILDYKLPDMSAENIIKEVDKNNINAYFIIITGYADVKVAVDMMKLGVRDYLVKDANFLELLPTVITRVFEELKKEQRLKDAQEALHRSEESYKLLAESIVDVIWMTDFDLNLIYLSQSIKDLLDYSPGELITEHVSKMLTPQSADLIINFYKNALQKLEQTTNNTIINHDMLEVEQVRKDGKTVWTEIRISFMFDTKNRVIGILGVSRDITSRKQALEKLNESFTTLRRALEASIEAMSKATEIRDPYTAGHQKRVSILAYEIAKEMNLSEDQCEGVRLAGAIHDIGKIYVPAEILSKPGRISENEFNIIKTHSQVGFDILKTIDFPWPIARIVLQHHERLNGSGYPLGIKGDEILIESKIISVSDVVEAMASYRPYRPALGMEEALKEIQKNRSVLYDPDIVDICHKVIVEKGFNFINL